MRSCSIRSRSMGSGSGAAPFDRRNPLNSSLRSFSTVLASITALSSSCCSCCTSAIISAEMTAFCFFDCFVLAPVPSPSPPHANCCLFFSQDDCAESLFLERTAAPSSRALLRTEQFPLQTQVAALIPLMSRFRTGLCELQENVLGALHLFSFNLLMRNLLIHQRFGELMVAFLIMCDGIPGLVVVTKRRHSILCGVPCKGTKILPT